MKNRIIPFALLILGFQFSWIKLDAQTPVSWTNTLNSVCVSSTSYLLTGGIPAGGTYSGPGVTGSNFNASAAGPGTHLLIYSFTDTTGFTDSDTNIITVYDLPAVIFPNTLPARCVYSGPFPLSGGYPPGGTYSGPGVTGNIFNPSVAGVGTHPITYTYTSPNTGCTNAAMNTITVNPLPNVTWVNWLPSLCINYPGITLSGGSPVGGTYSGIGVTGNIFNPSVAGVGTHTITYTYTSPVTGCSNSVTNTITVNPLPIVAFQGSLNPQCVSQTIYSLTGGVPLGGTYSGPGVTGNIFNAAVAGVGTYTITYTFTDADNCTRSATNTITVYPLPTITWLNWQDTCCINDPVLTLGGVNPLSGTYSGPGVTGNNFQTSVIGVGTYIITYTVLDNHGCMNSSVNTITVLPLPEVTWIIDPDTLFINDSNHILPEGSPPGGTFSGPGVNGNIFNASVAGTGTHILTYTYTDSHGCSGFDEDTMFVIADTLSDINGVLTYSNASSSPLSDAVIVLKQNGNIVDQMLTDSTGYFHFENLNSGSYTIETTVTKPWGGVNATDALLILKHFVGITPLSGINLLAADVDSSLYVNAVDALLVARRFVQMISSFNSGDWYVEKPVVTVTGNSTKTVNLKALCFGDVDGSYQ